MQFTWNQDGVDDADDDIIQGTYMVAETDGELRTTLTDDSGFSVPLTFRYSFENDTTLNLTLDAAQFNEVAESDFMETIRVMLLRS